MTDKVPQFDVDALRAAKRRKRWSTSEEERMAEKVPQFDVDAIRAAKRRKKGYTSETSGGSLGGEGSAGRTSGVVNPTSTLAHEEVVLGGDDSIQSDPTGMPDDALQLLGQSSQPPRPPGVPVNSIWDRRFANECHIDTHLLMAVDVAKFEEVGLLALFRAQEATSLRNAAMARFVEKEVRKMATQACQASTQLTEVQGKISQLEESHATEMAKAMAREKELEERLWIASSKLDSVQAREKELSEELSKLKAQHEKEAAQARFDEKRRNEEGILSSDKNSVDNTMKEFLDTHFEYEDLKEMVNVVTQIALKQQRERREGKVTFVPHNAPSKANKVSSLPKKVHVAPVQSPSPTKKAQLGGFADDDSIKNPSTPPVQSGDVSKDVGDTHSEGLVAAKEHFYLEGPSTNTHLEEDGDVEGSPSQLQSVMPKDFALSPRIIELPSEETLEVIVSPLSVDRVGQSLASASQTISTSKIEVPEAVADELYSYFMRNDSKHKKKGKNSVDEDEVLVKFDGNFLSRSELQSLAPREWISNFVVSFAAGYLNFYENKKANPNRFYLSSFFVDTVAYDINKHKKGETPLWDPGLLSSFFVEDLSTRNLIFAPSVYKEHWWCYVLNREAKTMYILDSMAHKPTNGGDVAVLDSLIVIRFKELMVMLNPTMDPTFEIAVEIEPLPEQPNKDDCGLYVMKYMEMWDGVTTYEGGLTMPAWDDDQLARIRRDLFVRWVMDKENKERDHVISAVKPQLGAACFVPAAAEGSVEEASKPTQQEQKKYPHKRARYPGRPQTSPYTISRVRPKTSHN